LQCTRRWCCRHIIPMCVRNATIIQRCGPFFWLLTVSLFVLSASPFPDGPM
jgi:hypothetical protein